ncbi:MAG: alanine--tRNA ligase [Nitrospirota bacterium]|nr:alanine--tRNA ligase [Nitrospirota bacterium]
MSLSSRQIREAFVTYFTDRKHICVPSAPLIPQNDPTLLFTNAGMVPFKRVFTGEEPRKAPCAVSVQKCVRAGGKHNDLENVGYTGRHHTFFEMLGNFSFGDYFKQDAIRFGWEFLTRELGLPRERLWVSVFREDDEAFAIWRDQEGVPESRIVRMGEKDNFWQMGDTGPCGPCTEIHIDQGPQVGCGQPTCKVGCDDDTCDRFLEVWNLVFMQYNRDSSGTLHPLPHPSIDTGMGLERLTAVVNGVVGNYGTDLFMPIIQAAAAEARVTYGSSRENDTALRVLADHCRAITFLLADGVLPSNEGRGYVLRRILRRAARYGRTIGLEGDFLARLTGVVVDQMGDAYPELVRSRDTIAAITRSEEERFSHTLDSGLERLTDALDAAQAKDLKDLPGEELFNLYDTYGFPADLASDIARERGMGVDMPGFQAAMNAQKERARASWKGADEARTASVYGEVAARAGATPFVGYTTTRHATRIAALIRDGAAAEQAAQGDAVEVILAETPFYAESGGQAGDAGTLSVETAAGVTMVEIDSTRRVAGKVVVHSGKVARGQVHVGDAVDAQVDAAMRRNTARNHTATHLLHAVLRDLLGEHVKQAGSLVEPGRLRFDFTHFQPLSPRDLERVEQTVNHHIRADSRVQTEIKDLEGAIASGAMALFGEKYDSEVRVVKIADVSTELCGGTHCGGVGEIGLFKIVSEGSVGAGVRRIEAVTGSHALAHVRAQEARLLACAQLFKATPDTLQERIEQLLGQLKEKDRQVAHLQQKLTEGGGDNEQRREVAGATLLARRDDGLNAGALRTLSDRVRDQLGTGAALLSSVEGERVSLLCVVSRDLVDRLSAGDLLREVAVMVGGKGGGRPDMAQGGGTNPAALDDALTAFLDLATKRLGG